MVIIKYEYNIDTLDVPPTTIIYGNSCTRNSSTYNVITYSSNSIASPDNSFIIDPNDDTHIICTKQGTYNFSYDNFYCNLLIVNNKQLYNMIQYYDRSFGYMVPGVPNLNLNVNDFIILKGGLCNANATTYFSPIW